MPRPYHTNRLFVVAIPLMALAILCCPLSVSAQGGSPLAASMNDPSGSDELAATGNNLRLTSNVYQTMALRGLTTW
ncbi:MAG: hypothetical protein O3C57_06035 [Verrucomicrobia bacterium]|nr:hypothetical protein [Verrucomicrobiota bacterium]